MTKIVALLRITFILLAISVLTSISSCSRSAVRFDPQPAPSWIASLPTSVDAQVISAVGQAPATTNPKQDLELAILNAKSQVAQLFESRVASRAFDWSLVMTGQKTKIQRDVFQTSVDVRSNVTVEDVNLAASYRDVNTRTQYAYIKVDRASWSNRLRDRIENGLDKMQKQLTAAKTMHKERRPLSSFKSLIRASHLGRTLEPDVLIIDLLESNGLLRDRLDSIKTKIDKLGRALRDEYRFILTIKAGDRLASKRVRADIEKFLGSWGFDVARKADAKHSIRIEISLEQHPVVIEKIANHKEHVHAATGRLDLVEPNGSVVSELCVRFESDRFQARHTNKTKAIQKAIQLAADTLSAKFRSAFRNVYGWGREN